MARLEADATPQTVNSDRIGTASRFARERGLFVVLKGARTVIARPDGAVAICPTGNPGMATAGTGDVLTGMMVGLLAQGMPSWEAACAATYLHGVAGDLAAAEKGASRDDRGRRDRGDSLCAQAHTSGFINKTKPIEIWNALL